ncbi:MAG: cupin domain-containing protein [Thiotrichaceae bacterium]|nr:cupin domain-containing protein [Thiotrichaceae bacterium]
MYTRWITELGLEPHPEGGFYRRNYTADCYVLPENFAAARPVASAIYYLLPASQFSALHRIKSDELWHFYAGGSLNIYVITPEGELKILRLGLDLARGEQPQQRVPAGCWFGACVAHGEYVLVGCTVAPAFDFADFELGKRAELWATYPQHADIIERLTAAC